MKRSIVLAIVLLLTATIAFGADPPVKATVTVSGSALPGATITAKAAITINDGSTLQSVQWKQTAGVPVTLANAATDTVTVTLPAMTAYRKELIAVMKAPPMSSDQLPSFFPEREYENGLQDRWSVVAIPPTPLTKAGAVVFELTVVTTSGSYKLPATVATTLPYPTATGLRNVPLKKPVLLHGRAQASYDWTLKAPAGSTATLVEATAVAPEFTPDVPGTYEINVTDLKENKTVTLSVHVGKWQGMITGQTADGRPVPDPACMQCHVKNTPHFDLFTPWAKSGHATIFSDNVVNTAPDAHYSASCLSCHVVGYDRTTDNGGFDDVPGFQDFLKSGLLEHGGVDNWAKIQADYPAVARMANIQCENCHGPQDSAAHMKKDGSRKTLSSDLCASCHGRAPRHGRYQQWQLSGHGNYQLAIDEGTDPSCAKCHSAQGFIAWQGKNFSTANLTVDWTTDEVHPQTCVTCHDPHNVGTTSKEGHIETNAPMRVKGATPALMSGFTAKDVGNAAICMTCHNGRRGLRNDANFTVADATRAPHAGPQADVIMGENMYFVPTGKRSFHSMIEDSCVTCHMESTEAPSQLYTSEVGTNHTFFANPDICVQCHSNITLESVQKPIEEKMDALKLEIEKSIKYVMQAQIRAGNVIDANGTKIRSAADVKEIEFIESHGRQGVNIVLADGTRIPDLSLQSVKVVRGTGSSVELYSVADPALGKAGWNYFMAHSDKSKGVHNPTFVTSALDVALYAIRAANNVAVAGGTPPGVVPASIGGGLGNGAGAVSCTTPYVYWAEIAGRTPGNNGSQWRTDLVTRNLGTSNAALKFVFHTANGNVQGTASVPGSGQKGFEDVVGMLGADNSMGALEICSDQPLLVNGRVFNDAGESGTFGQNLDGHVANLGYGEGQTINLIGLRQQQNRYRTNIIVTNAGTSEAQVSIALFDGAGTWLSTYQLTVPAGLVINDTEPFIKRAGKPDLGWGFATVTVLKGANIRTMASVIDTRTNDPTSIPPKQ
ncbi:MAG TPA: multiheme c-type cytochrome [Thermoanaerobaculia bacterium]